MMRFVLVLLLAMAATLTWQTHALAGVAAGACTLVMAADDKTTDGTTKSGEQEPECE